MSIGKKNVTPPKPPNWKAKPKGKITESSLTHEERAAISRENGKKSREKHVEMAYPKSDEYTPDYRPEDMYADIYHPNALIAPELKIHAAQAYFVTGTIEGASRITGLSHQCISEWKNHAEWWYPTLQKIRKEKNDELDAEVTNLIHKVTGELLEVLDNGEEIFHQGVPTGHRKKVGGRDLASILNTLYDKRTMMRGEPTSIKAVQDKGALMDELRGEFKKMAEEAEKRRKVVSEQ